MTANKLLFSALLLLGYTDNGDGIPQDIRQISLTVINCVLSDVCHLAGVEFKALGSLFEEITLEDKYIDIALYGVSAFISANKCDTVRQQYFSTLYNTKRMSVTKLESITDKMP